MFFDPKPVYVLQQKVGFGATGAPDFLFMLGVAALVVIVLAAVLAIAGVVVGLVNRKRERAALLGENLKRATYQPGPVDADPRRLAL